MIFYIFFLILNAILLGLKQKVQPLGLLKNHLHIDLYNANKIIAKFLSLIMRNLFNRKYFSLFNEDTINIFSGFENLPNLKFQK